MDVRVDDWCVDVLSTGLQKCLSGPPGSAPITFNERVEERVLARKHIEQGILPDGFRAAQGPVIRSNYFDLAMLMDYWSEARLNHHTEATSMLYAARECARVLLAEGLDAAHERHRAGEPCARCGPACDGSRGLRRPGPQDAQRDRSPDTRRACRATRSAR